MSELKLSVIIPTYNRCNDLNECLESLFEMKRVPDEVIVVDSCSTDSTYEVARRFPVNYIRISERSMVKARNVGLKRATGDVVAYVDDDVVVSRDWSINLLEPYEDDKVGGVGGRVLPYGVHEGFYTLVRHCDVGRVLSNGMVFGNFDIPVPTPIEVDTLIGCNMSFRRGALIKIGGFDENFVGNCFRDETDVCIRLKRSGYKLVYNSKAVVWHKFRGKVFSYERFYSTIRNHAYFYFKNFQPITPWKFVAFLLGTFFPPPDYMRKSGIEIKFNPILVVLAVRGIIDAWKTFHK